MCVIEREKERKKEREGENYKKEKEEEEESDYTFVGHREKRSKWRERKMCDQTWATASSSAADNAAARALWRSTEPKVGEREEGNKDLRVCICIYTYTYNITF
jgi:hypothetical protein